MEREKNSSGGISIFHVMTVQRVMNRAKIWPFSHSKRKDFHWRGRKPLKNGILISDFSTRGCVWPLLPICRNTGISERKIFAYCIYAYCIYLNKFVRTKMRPKAGTKIELQRDIFQRVLQIFCRFLQVFTGFFSGYLQSRIHISTYSVILCRFQSISVVKENAYDYIFFLLELEL